MQPIIESLLDTDLYKFNVQQIIFHRYNNLRVRYSYTCRNAEQIQLARYVSLHEIKEQLYHLSTLSLTRDEQDYMRSRDYISPEYFDFLRNFRFNIEDYLRISPKGDSYQIDYEGPWLSAINIETFVATIINALYARNYAFTHGYNEDAIMAQVHLRLDNKINLLNTYEGPPLKIIEFGTRRRHSAKVQSEVLLALRSRTKNLVGTSNVLLAMRHDLPAIGTFGHEFVMGLQGIHPLQDAQREAFRVWLEEYRGAWGIALTDTYGDDKFRKDFTLELARGYEGVRHDSGDPFAYTQGILDMYKNYNIDARSKRIVYSDSLTVPLALQLHTAFHDQIQTSFGIGTNLTNDTGLIPVAQNVMKITYSQGQPVIKVSNDPGKVSSPEPEYIKYALETLKRHS